MDVQSSQSQSALEQAANANGDMLSLIKTTKEAANGLPSDGGAD